MRCEKRCNIEKLGPVVLEPIVTYNDNTYIMVGSKFIDNLSMKYVINVVSRENDMIYYLINNVAYCVMVN